MAEMMKEVVVVEPHKYEVREVEIPELANEDEVLIQMKSAGVCGSDHLRVHQSANGRCCSNRGTGNCCKECAGNDRYQGDSTGDPADEGICKGNETFGKSAL